MQITNIHNVPQEVFDWLSRNEYVKVGDYSASSLIKPPQMAVLEERYGDKCTRDCLDYFFSSLGTAVHDSLSKHDVDDGLVEERFAKEYAIKLGDKPSQILVTGQSDLYHDGIIKDYKCTSAYAFLIGGLKPEWEQQLNIYAELVRHSGFPVKKLEIHCLLRDWSRFKGLTEKNYPKIPFHILDVPIWDELKATVYIRERIMLHETAKGYKPEDLAKLYPCTPDEQWGRPEVFKIMKEGRKRSIKNFDVLEMAQSYMRAHGKQGMAIVRHPGKKVRCEDYCAVKDFCYQYKEESWVTT